MMLRDTQRLLILGALITAPAAYGQAVDTSEWACQYCPFEDGYTADYAIGATSVGEDSAYVGDATGYDEEGVYANVDGQGSYARDDYRMRWTLDDLGLDSRALAIEGGQPGTWDYDLAYSELPRRRFATTQSVYVATSDTALTLPSGWVSAPTTAGLTQLGSSLRRTNIESDRALFAIGGRYLPSRRWSVTADYRRRENDGVRLYSGSSFTSSAELPMPFDYVTDEVDIGIAYGADNGFVALGWYLSDFANSNAALSWESPYGLLAAGPTYALAQAPGSRFQQLSLRASYSFPGANTVASISAAMGDIEQDAAFLPYTMNSGLAVDPLPRSNLDGQVDTSNFAFAVTSRFIDKLRVKLSYRIDERDNKTAQAQWNRVITDTFISNEFESNIPYSFERSALSLRGDYDLFDTVRVSAGYDRKDVDRDFQEVAEQTEDTGWGRLRWQPTPALELDIKGGTSRRDIDRYNESFATVLEQNPLLRKYNLAYRYREFGEITLAFAPAERPVSMTLSALVADDSFTRSQLGMLSADEFRLAADITWTVSDNASVYVNAGMEDIESVQAGSGAFAAADWRATHDDDFTTIGFGFHVRNLGANDNFDLAFDYLDTDGGSEIIVDSDVTGLSEFPELQTELAYARLRLSYRSSERMEWNLNLRYQRFLAEDWALEGVRPATMPTVLSLGAQPYSPDVLLVGFGFRYRIGGDDE